MIDRITYDDNTNEFLDDLAWEFDTTAKNMVVALCIYTSISLLLNPNLMPMFEDCVKKAKEAYKNGYRTGDEDNE